MRVTWINMEALTTELPLLEKKRFDLYIAPFHSYLYSPDIYSIRIVSVSFAIFNI